MSEKYHPSAFPITEDRGESGRWAEYGMTMLDWFAGQAMIALMSNSAWVAGLDKIAHDQGYDFKSSLAANAYKMATEMMDEREKHLK